MPRLRILLLILLLFAAGIVRAQSQDSAVTQESAEDAYLRGALTVMLEQQLGWAHGSYQLRVHEGIATITLPEEDAARRASVADKLKPFDGLQGINIVISPHTGVGSEKTGATVSTSPPKIEPNGSARELLYSFLGITNDTVPFPVGDLFLPLLADPKQPQFFTSYRYYNTPVTGAHAAAVGYGETFGFFRRQGRAPGDGLQIGVAGALFAQFNLDAPSADLINADYTIGFPLSWRRGDTSARLRIYHQSSHLGDEYLLRAKPDRINLSFESVEMLLSQEWHPWRVYLGGEYLFHREPSDLKPSAAHGGLEFRTSRPVWGTGHWVGGIDLKSWEEHNWAVDTSVKVGLEFGAVQPGHRRVRLMLEGYSGYSPHGQFYDDKMTYYGIGLYLGF